MNQSLNNPRIIKLQNPSEHKNIIKGAFMELMVYQIIMSVLDSSKDWNGIYTSKSAYYISRFFHRYGYDEKT
jgi:hypothetical protein